MNEAKILKENEYFISDLSPLAEKRQIALSTQQYAVWRNAPALHQLQLVEVGGPLDYLQKKYHISDDQIAIVEVG